MSILRTIKCNVSGCPEQATEAASGGGWPGWGVLQGRTNENGETDFHLCPVHIDVAFKALEGVR